MAKRAKCSVVDPVMRPPALAFVYPGDRVSAVFFIVSGFDGFPIL
jgi:hypothetical protein